MEYDDADPAGVPMPQAVCWEELKYRVLPAVDIPCRLEVAGRRVPIPLVRARIRLLAANELGYFHTVQMYLYRAMSLGAFGPKFEVFCQADGRDASQLHLRAHTDRAFESKVVTNLLAGWYGLQWRLIRLFGGDAEKSTKSTLDGVRVYFDDVLVYTFGQLTQEGMSEGFHRKAFAFLAEHLRGLLISRI